MTSRDRSIPNGWRTKKVTVPKLGVITIKRFTDVREFAQVHWAGDDGYLYGDVNSGNKDVGVDDLLRDFAEAILKVVGRR